VFCHTGAHIATDECGAPEFFTGGGRLHLVEGAHGKIDNGELIGAIGKYPRDFIHHGQPAAISITQLSETGTAYSIEEIRQISDIAKNNELPLHMDGARFANAVAAVGITPAEMTWKSGVDILTFGGTKNGCWCAEAVVFFKPEMAKDFAFIHKRAGQLYSKTCFLSAQFEAYLEGERWLDLARHANDMASRLAANIEMSSKLRLAWPPDGNEVFAIMAADVMEELKAAGAVFFGKAAPDSHGNAVKSGEILARFVCSFATAAGEVDRFGELIR
jgi:threonine aldolase